MNIFCALNGQLKASRNQRGKESPSSICLKRDAMIFKHASDAEKDGWKEDIGLWSLLLGRWLFFVFFFGVDAKKSAPPLSFYPHYLKLGRSLHSQIQIVFLWCTLNMTFRVRAKLPPNPPLFFTSFCYSFFVVASLPCKSVFFVAMYY